jgi:[ribosomal protein S5]-alanine N-acetyltransferase
LEFYFITKNNEDKIVLPAPNMKTDHSVRIRPLTLADAPRLAEFANNENISKNLRDGFPHPYTLDDAERFLTGAVAQYPAQIMGIEYNGLYVGNIGLHIGADVYRKSAELGYLLDEKYWNRGIMTRAVHQMCDYGFRELDIVRIYAGVFEYNLSSQRLLEKCGFQKEAVFRKAVFKMGEIWDEIRYSKIILMPQLQIQKASINDVSVLKKIGRQTFYETFHDTNTEDNLRKYLDESFADEKLKEELSNPLSWFYFAAIEDKVVGYLKVNFGQAQTEFRHDGWFEVERIYVVQ